MATLNFTSAEAMNILAANNMLPESIKDIKPETDGLQVTVSGGIVIRVRRESFANGILKLSFGSNNWAFKIADSLGKVDRMLDDALGGFPFIRREGKALFIDLNRALQARVRGVQVKNCELRDGAVRIEF
jgi:hypothetical protein